MVYCSTDCSFRFRPSVTISKQTLASRFNFLGCCRFRWRRRLFVISAPNDEEWAYQQQLYALASQACNLGELFVTNQSQTINNQSKPIDGLRWLYPCSQKIHVYLLKCLSVINYCFLIELKCRDCSLILWTF